MRRVGALLCFVLADQVAAHPRAAPAVDVRPVGAAEADDPDPYATGKRLLAADDAVGALAAFQRALAAAPQSVDALNGIGVSYDRLGRPDLARRFYEDGLAIDPHSPTLLNNYGYSLYLDGNEAAAIAPLRAAAASGDAASAAAAAATLARLTDVREAHAQAAVVPAPTLRIEQTSAGEQRLTFAAKPPPAAVAASLGSEAAAVAVAPAWTAADDAALAAEVRHDEQAEAAARQPSAAPTGAAEPAATAAPVAAAPPPPPVHAQAIPMPSGLLVAETRDIVPSRRRDARAARTDVAVSSTGPRFDTREFDSDDAELNAFAARVSRRRGLAEAEGGRAIAESFRG